MPDSSYTDEWSLADYYWLLVTVRYVRFEQVLPNLLRWINTGEILIVDADGNILDPKQQYRLIPRPFVCLAIEIVGVSRDLADFRVRIPETGCKSTVETYPPPDKPPRFTVTVAEVLGLAKPAVTEKPLTAKEQRGKLEAEAFAWLMLEKSLKADVGCYWDEAQRRFPGIRQRGLGRALEKARDEKGLLKRRAPRKRAARRRVKRF